MMRIVSVVPSLTELLFDLGLEEEVAGITKFCIHPEKWFRSKTRVGGTKTLHLNTIQELNPTLIIANKEENTKEQIEACQSFCEVYVSDISNYEEALAAIKEIGSKTNKDEAAKKLSADIRTAFNDLTLRRHNRKRIVYLIWKDPLMTIGNDTFIHDMISRAGFDNAFGDQKRYPQITEKDLADVQPDAVFLSSEPYPFSEKHIPYFRKLLPDAEIITVDGELFSWYGSRMRLAPAYFESIKI